MRTIREGEHAVVIDERWSPPVVFITWFGASTERIVREYFAWNKAYVEEAIRTKTPRLMISDSIDATRPPPKVRALMAELSDQQPRAEGLVFVYLVLPNPLIRGVMTALQWVTRRPLPVEIVSTMEEALERGFADLERAGGRRPLKLDAKSYVRPQRPAAA
jgi:hypothetical protein